MSENDGLVDVCAKSFVDAEARVSKIEETIRSMGMEDVLKEVEERKKTQYFTNIFSF